MARIDNLTNFLTDVAVAIKDKKGITETITPANFDTEIASIETGGNSYKIEDGRYFFYQGARLSELDNIAAVSAFKDCSSMFSQTRNKTTINVKNLDMSHATKIDGMFQGCFELTNLDFSSWNTPNLTSMRGVFNGDSKLKTINFKNVDTSKVTDMSSLFLGCSALTNLDISTFNTSNTTSLAQMFSGCSALTALDLSGWDTSKVTNYEGTFMSCKNLQELDIRNFDFTKASSYSSVFSSIPADCLIIVKDDTAKDWVLARRSDFTNVKTVAELA